MSDPHAEVEALRLQVASETGAKARYLSGSTREELEASAAEYLADHPPAPRRVPATPVEDLRGGGDPDEETDEARIRRIVDAIPRGI